MRVSRLWLAVALLGFPSVAVAQDNAECTGQSFSGYAEAMNLCNASVDATRFFHPLMGLAITGGNPVVGSFRTLGGLGHLSIGVRATAFEVALPDLSYDGSTSEVPQGEEVPFGAPTVDVGIGLFNGMSSGLLSVDLLGSIVAVPNNIDDLQVDPDASTLGDFAYKIGYGARVGILRGGFPIPSVNVSWMRREIPQVQFGDVEGGDEFSYRIGLKSTAIRAVAGWRIALFDIGVGLGTDTYTGDALIQFDNPDPSDLDPTPEEINISLDNSRTTLFADIGLNLGPIKIAGEVGMQTENDLDTVSDFEGIDVNEGRKYASVGVRIAF